MSSPNSSPSKSNSGGCLAVVLIIGFLVLVAQCSSKNGSSSTSTENVAMTDMNSEGATAPEAAPSPPTGGVQPLDGRAADTAIAQEKTAAAAEGLSGAMIYSQNCYDALGRAFTWSKLDTCGAFDAMAAARLTDDEAISHDKEASHFDGETAAGRYLAAATGAGEEPAEADERWAKLQARAKAALRTRKPTTVVETPSAGELQANETLTAAEQAAAEGAQLH